MASAVSPISSSTGIAGLDTSTSSVQSSLATPSKDLFLQLLVAQIKNQDPLNPTDSTQFVSQLSQFSELEQIMAIRADLEGIAAGTGTTQTGSPATGSTGAV